MIALALLLAFQDPVDRDGLAFFESKIRPVLVDKCHSCHSADAKKLKGELFVDSRDGLLKGGEAGPSVVPGDLDKSLLIKAIRYTDDDLKMPPKNRLSREVVADFEAWVKRGAPMPASKGAGPAARKGYNLGEARKAWPYRPLAPAEGPSIDAILRASGKPPGAFVDRRRLIRRATYDLTGLPPAPADVDAFVADASPDAFATLVDRLLASPAYGERWARHWLDVARFAESHGFEQDYDREHAWTYRDFVIRALNDDLPYDEFVRWQVAGDELAPANPLAWMATGFLGAGAFPTQLTEAEFESARYDELDSMVSTTGSAVLGLSIGCARCHDHKFDPIPAKDYYRMAATFTSAIRAHAEFALDPDGDRERVAGWTREREAKAAALAAYQKEKLPAAYEAWKASRAPGPSWVVLDDVALKSSHKTAFAPQGDGSFLATGDNPKNDRWVATVRTPFKGVVAVKVEALAHPSLKMNGPGRAPNGNFALTDVRVKGATISSAKATFEQNGATLSAAAAIDGDPSSGWAVDPQFGKDHAIEFALEAPVDLAEIVIELKFDLNAQHSIGRPRVSILSTVDAPAYARLDPEAKRLGKALAEHDAKKPVPKVTTALVTTEGMKPLKHHADDRGFPHFYKETHVLARGDVNKKQGVAPPGFLELLTRGEESTWTPAAPAGSRTPHRRAALARWLTDVEKGAGALAARVIVNRLWAHHFGKGIVGTPNDFGAQGEPPTDPALLDWLARELIRNGWRLKPVHRQMMLSDAYRRAGAPRRLEAEAIRDALLDAGGLLDRRMHGPGSTDPSMTRRSVYFFLKRSQLPAMMQLFDAPEALVSIGDRPSTTIAPQALLFLNGPLVRKAAAGLASRVAVDPVRGAYRLALGREPSKEEAASAESFIAAQAASYGGKREPAVVDFCHAVLCLNEFIYVD